MTNRIATVVVVCGLSVLLPGCFRGAVDDTDIRRRDSLLSRESPLLPAPKPIPAGNCRVVARVVSIDTSVTSGDAADPCSRTRCRAAVVVLAVDGIGPDFPAHLVRDGDLLVVTFPGTLLPHDERFNGLLVKSYPGLVVGSRFRADFALELADGAVADPTTDGSLTAYDYELLDD